MTMLMRKPPKLSIEASTIFKDKLQFINNENIKKFDLHIKEKEIEIEIEKEKAQLMFQR